MKTHCILCCVPRLAYRSVGLQSVNAGNVRADCEAICSSSPFDPNRKRDCGAVMLLIAGQISGVDLLGGHEVNWPGL